MAFDKKKFVVSEGACGTETSLRRFRYTSTDTFTAIKAAGYFNDMRESLHPNNTIEVRFGEFDESGTTGEWGILQVVLAGPTGNVTTVPLALGT